VRKLIIVISAVAALGVFATNTARAQAAEQNQQAIPAQYQDDYGHWQHCADVTGMCGVTTG
jgi:invasion protein IalB